MDYIYYDKQALETTLKKYHAGDKAVCSDMEILIKVATEALEKGPFSVTDKKMIPIGATKHDYSSIGTYWWPDPEKPDGLPYIRRDGYTNPQVEDTDCFDRRRMDAFFKTVSDLAIAYYYSKDDKYKSRAEYLIKVWFIDEETKMNPNLRYAQSIPGRCDGRDIGIIDTYSLADFIDSLLLIGYEGEELKQWLKDYRTWLTTHENGVRECQKLNNHGMWYDVQVMAISAYLGDYDFIKKQAEEYSIKRIEDQIAPDGSLPEELARTKSKSYTTFCSRAIIGICSLASQAGLDLWNYKSANNVTPKDLFEFPMPYILGEKEWEWPQVEPFSILEIVKYYNIGYNVYGCEKYNEIADYIINKYKNDDTVGVLCRYPKR